MLLLLEKILCVEESLWKPDEDFSPNNNNNNNNDNKHHWQINLIKLEGNIEVLINFHQAEHL